MDSQAQQGPEPATGSDDGSGPVAAQDEPAADGELGPGEQDEPQEEVTDPARLIRIASAVQAMLQEVQTTELDEAARERLTDIHNRTLGDLRSIVSDDLQEELRDLNLGPADGTPSGDELRVIQAQLSGWLQGLFHGIQASLATQMSAQQQPGRMQGQPDGRGGDPGQYL